MTSRGVEPTTAEPPEHSSHSPAAELRRWAEADKRQVISLIRTLVARSSRGGLDSYDPVIELVTTWLDDRGLPARLLRDATHQTVGIVCDVPGAHPGPRYVLDACVDTAPFGDLASWRHPPTSAAIEDGWLYGRGAADSKAAIAIFLHIAARLRQQTARLYGTLTLLFDADEHTGRFGGAKNYFGGMDAPNDVAGVMIGYPGADELVVGGRGFLRAEMIVRGHAGHTGSRRSDNNDNAVEKAAELVRALAGNRKPGSVDPTLELSPKLTVTGIDGGESYSIIPDHCIVKVDVRLTTSFDAAAAQDLIQQVAAQIDNRWPASEQTTTIFHESWPAYRLAENVPIRVALLDAARRHMPNPVTAKVAGPSNIGNYLASLGISATAGLGVRYEGLHGTDERIELATIPAVQATYHDALLSLLTRPD